jgi:hypothetical protein
MAFKLCSYACIVNYWCVANSYVIRTAKSYFRQMLKGINKEVQKASNG